MAKVRLLVSRVVRRGRDSELQHSGAVVSVTSAEASRLIDAGQAEKVMATRKRTSKRGD